ncbi:MAG: MmgE/PrpD family protein [Alphaproteobacteria bacterium]|jgi:2-methylcitrate dehydratase PrpD
MIKSFAEWAANPDLAFSDTALHQARLSFVDTLACMLAAKDDPLVRHVASAMENAGALGQADTVVSDVRLSAPAAALVNGAAAHALDFDDYETIASTHPSAVIIPALLALSDLRPTSLQSLLTAYLVGYEAIVYMGQILGGYEHYLAGWHSTSTIGPIGAVTAVAKLIELDAVKTAHAMSIAMSTSAGIKVQFGTGVKPVHAGFAARAGVEAALLAESGVFANPDAMDGPYGFIALYGNLESSPDRPTLPANRKACAMDTNPVLRKPWPSCSYTHRTIEAAQKLAQMPGIETEQIVRGIIHIPEPFFRVASFLRPENPNQARFSLLYCVASTLSDGGLFPASFSLQAIERPNVRELMELLEISAYDPGPDIQDLSPSYPDRLSLYLADGREHHETISQVKGGNNNPMGMSDIRGKFDLCGGNSALFDLLLLDQTAQPPQFTGADWKQTSEPHHR